jgi:HAD superfamily hydrolase (TIGR01509 family)
LHRPYPAVFGRNRLLVKNFRMANSTTEALIFDVDGTLADTERDGHRVAFNLAFAAAGLDWNWDVPLYGELLAVTGGKERIRHYLERYRPDFIRPGGLGDLIAELHRSKTAHYTAMLARGEIPLRAGVRRLLREARAAGLRLAIASTTTPENVTALLASTLGAGADDLFEVIGAGDIVPAKKPAPDIYRYVLQRLRLAPERAVAFEDSAHGLRAACAAGLTTVVTINDYTRGQDFSGAAIVLDSLGEPQFPFRVIAGLAADRETIVDLAMLRRLREEPVSDRCVKS